MKKKMKSNLCPRKTNYINTYITQKPHLLPDLKNNRIVTNLPPLVPLKIEFIDEFSYTDIQSIKIDDTRRISEMSSISKIEDFDL